MAENNNSPGVSKKTQRPKGSPEQQQQPHTASAIVDPSKQSCKLCTEFDSLDMVRCDGCNEWFHFVCVEVTREVENEVTWMCNECSSKSPIDQPSSKRSDGNKSKKSSRLSNSQKSRGSSAVKRKQLTLERVEEERRLREIREKEYLDEKYKALAELDASETELSEDEDLELLENTRQYTHEWVEELGGLVKITKGNVLNSTESDGQAMLTRTEVNSREVLTSTRSNIVPTSEQHSFAAGFADFWQRYTNEVARAYQREFPSNIISETSQEFVQHSQVSNVVGQSSNLRSSNESMPTPTAVTESIGQSIAESSVASNVANINSTSTTSRVVNPATKPSILRTKNSGQTTYSVFTNQAPIMNSSVDNSGHFNYLNASSQAHVGFLNQQILTNELNSGIFVPASQVQMPSIQHPYVDQPSNSIQSLAHSTYSGQVHVDNSRHPPMLTFPNFESQCTSSVAVTNQNGFGNSSNNEWGNETFVQVPQSSSSMNHQVYNQPFIVDRNVGEAIPTSVPGQPILISFNGNVPTSSVVISRPSAGHSSGVNEQWRPPIENASSTLFEPQQTFSAHSQRGDGDNTRTNRASSRLEANQIAARQAMPKSLPAFDGAPKDWLIFISAYENSNGACGYTNSENLGRLTDCLKGDAKTAVSSMLLHPDSVPQIIETLRMLFGRPELIIESLLEELQNELSPKENDLAALVKYALKVRNLVETIRQLGPLDHLSNPVMLKILVDKLPTQTRVSWAHHKFGNPRSNLASFGDWLYNLAQVTSQVLGPAKLDSAKKERKEDRKDKHKGQKSNASQLNVHVDNNSTRNKSGPKQDSRGSKQCPVCSIDTCKQIQECKKFRSLKPSERWNLTKEKRLCYSCFGNHRQFRCRSRKKCQIDGCQATHHILLHDSERQSLNTSQTISNSSISKNSTEAEKKPVSSENSSGTNSKSCNSIQVRQRSAKFRIVPVVLYANKKAIKTFAYYDDGSDLSLIERGLANELGLIGIPDYLNVRWAFKNTEEETDSEIVSLRISGDFQCAEEYKIENIFTVDELFLPAQSITRKWLDSYEHLKDLPIAMYEDATPRILIGLHYSKLMVSQKTVEGKWTEPIACRTRLGWVIQGPDDNDDSEQISDTRVSLNIYECHTDNQLHNLVKEFFSFESFGTQISQNMLESKEAIRAREIMESTTVKINGRFETGLLWRNDDVHLPDSYAMALKRLNCLEKKMQKDPNLAKKLSDQIEDFVEKKYIRKLPPHEVTQVGPRTWYLPIFVVFNPKKPLKVRTVWDAAAKVKNVSLNSVLLKGPDQLVPLPDVLRRFRERFYAITGDIGEMYHRIGVIEKDRCAQRFLWRDGKSDRKPDVYEMEVLTFGSSCSPSSAQFVKNKNALEYMDRFPRAVEAIVENTYIDDMLDCTHTIDEAVCLAKNAKFIHHQASFELGKFVSNSSEVLRALGTEDSSQIKNLNLSLDTKTERVLGMFWNTSTDMFTFSLKYAKIDEMVMTGNRNPTKREVLRALMSIFDPLGLIANVLVHAKILLQRIWRKSTGWDEQINESLQEDWLSWIRLLPQVETLAIPRLYSPKLSPKSPKSIQMHTFVDAGIEACAAMTYLRFEDEFGVDCALVGAKTKIAPNKPLTVPRLELQAAVLGTRLAGSVGKSQRLKIDKRFFWSDSQTVLSWIMSETRKYNQFVAFRVGEILENSVEDEWNWVSTSDNVADEATKSKNKPEISSTSRWFKGPSFLYQTENQWDQAADKSKFTTDEELRPRYLLAQFVNKSKNVIDPNNFSSWKQLRRTLALVLRFIDNLKFGKKNRLTGPLSREEHIRAENKLYQQTQKDKFIDEIAIIRHNAIAPIEKRKDFDKASILRTFSPYIDEVGVVRMKGRIDAAKHLSFQTKRPIILPRDHRITKLIVNDYHRKYHHLNHQTTLNELHQRYYIPSMRRTLKSVIHNICQRCKNDRANPKVPEMADLPPARVATFTPAFTFCGVDYFGPFTVKVNTTKRKRWGVLFTCLTTRAIHIEVAEGLTTNECILAVTRFTGRRGTPAEFYSDNGSNFHGSERELREEFEKLDFSKIEETFTNETSQWKFNPPAAPHMGGSWERMIQTVKALLKKTMPTRTPTVKMFETYLVEAEYIINSRPLTYVHLDHLEDEVLTPNHFLLGSSGGVRTPGIFDETCLLRDDWKAVQHLTDLFWRRFNIEYLPTLTRRTKWFKDVKPVEVGDVVIIVDHKHPRNTWPKGIVEEIFPGRGKRVRQAKIRLVKGRDNLSKINVKNIKHQSLIRPVAKLAVLDVHKEKLSSPPEAVNGRKDVANAPESHITDLLE